MGTGVWPEGAHDSPCLGWEQAPHGSGSPDDIAAHGVIASLPVAGLMAYSGAKSCTQVPIQPRVLAPALDPSTSRQRTH